jgi:hypothetical protein
MHKKKYNLKRGLHNFIQRSESLKDDPENKDKLDKMMCEVKDICDNTGLSLDQFNSVLTKAIDIKSETLGNLYYIFLTEMHNLGKSTEGVL